METKKLKINRELLKLIASLTMLIDHIGLGMIDKALPLYIVMRVIGRAAMPLYAIMIAEGLYHTKNEYKYTFRVLLTAIVSIVPYHLYVLDRQWIIMPNVLFTYALAMITIIEINKLNNIYLKAAIGALSVFISFFLNFEYTYIPLIIIWAFYFLRGYIPIEIYVKEDGYKLPNWVYYAFYPGHLIILYLIKLGLN